MSIADTMATNGMKEAGYEYINLDGACVSVSATLSSCVCSCGCHMCVCACALCGARGIPVVI